MERSDFPAQTDGFVTAHFVVAEDLERTVHFYSHVLGGESFSPQRALRRS